MLYTLFFCFHGMLIVSNIHLLNYLRYFVEVKFNSFGSIHVKGNEIIMSIKSEPKHGKANKEMIKKLSDFFVVPENSIHIISGLTSRKKIIEIQNM